jgi:hypothetical protein
MPVPANASVLRLAVMIALAVCAAAPVCAQPAADKPAIKVGDAWMYSMTTDSGKEAKEVSWARRAVAVGADGSVDVQIGERIEKLDAAGNLIDPKGAEFNRMIYKFPMQVGSEWTWVAKFGTQVVMEQRGTFKVVAYEPLTVPAGTFDCYRVEGKSDAAYKVSFQQQVKTTYWYCPKVNAIGRVLRETTVTARDSPSSHEKVDQVLVKYLPKG